MFVFPPENLYFLQMPSSRIQTNIADRIASIVLDRPEKRNALDDVMVGELRDAFLGAAQDESVKVVLLSGQGPAFCAGADLGYLSRISKFDLEQNRVDSKNLADLFLTVYRLQKPVVAMVDGPALAGGCGLASVCDIVVASGEATFGYTEVRIGFLPAVVMTFLVRRVGEGRARELVLRGNVIDAQEALRIGLVNIVVPRTELSTSAHELCGEMIRKNSLTAMGRSKDLLARIGNSGIEEALAIAAEANASARMTEDCQKGVSAFLSKRKLSW